METIITEIQKLSLKENEILVLRIDKELPNADYRRIGDRMRDILDKNGYKNDFLMLEKELSLEILENKL